MMKKVLVLLVGMIFVLSLTGLAFAQAKPEKPAAPAKPAEPAKPTEVAKPAEAAKPAVEAKKEAPKKEAPPKPVMYRLGGQVTAVDMVAKKITISQNAVKQQKKATLKVGKKAAAGMSGINVGDVVNVWVTDGTVTTLTKIY